MAAFSGLSIVAENPAMAQIEPSQNQNLDLPSALVAHTLARNQELSDHTSLPTFSLGATQASIGTIFNKSCANSNSESKPLNGWAQKVIDVINLVEHDMC